MQGKKEECKKTVVCGLMPRSKFDDIMKYLLAADNKNLQTADKFAKVRPLVDGLNERCLYIYQIYIASQVVSFDEALTPHYRCHYWC